VTQGFATASGQRDNTTRDPLAALDLGLVRRAHDEIEGGQGIAGGVIALAAGGGEALGDGPDVELLASLAGDGAEGVLDTLLFPRDDVDEGVARADEVFELTIDVAWQRGRLRDGVDIL